MKNVKRIIAVLLSFVLIAAVFTGCTGKSGSDGQDNSTVSSSSNTVQDTKENTPAEKPGLKHLGYYGTFDPNTDPVAKALEEKTGYKVEYFMLPNENSDEKLNLEIVSGAEYDSLKLTPAQYSSLAGQGALVVFDDLLAQYGQNIKDAISEESWNATKIDGKLYGIPEKNPGSDINTGLVIRKDILDELGLSVPTNLDEFYNVLKTIKEKKNIIPLTGASTDGVIGTIASAFGVYTLWTDVGGQLVHQAALPATKNYLEFMQKLYKEGLLDKEYPTNTFETKVEKITSGKAAAANFGWYNAPSVKPALIENFPDASLSIIQPLKGPNGEQGILRVKGITYVAAIPKSSKHAEDAAKWYNLKFDHDIFKYFTIGTEGVDYKVENGKYIPILPKFEEDRNNSSWYLSGNDEKNYPVYWQARVRKNPDLAEWFDEITQADETLGKFEPLAFAPSLTSIGKYMQAFSKAYSDEMIKITVGEDISSLDKLIEKWKGEGLDEMTKEANEWYSKNK